MQHATSLMHAHLKCAMFHGVSTQLLIVHPRHVVWLTIILAIRLVFFFHFLFLFLSYPFNLGPWVEIGSRTRAYSFPFPHLSPSHIVSVTLAL